MTEQKKEYRWATLGCGVIAHQLSEAMESKGRKLYSVANRTYEKAVAFANQYGIEKVYKSIDEVFEDENVDIIYISTPHNTHINFLRKALKAGKHVLCEKPMAVDAKTCDRMVAAEKKFNAKLMIAQCVRYWPEYCILKDYLDSKKYGKVIAADFTRFSPAPVWNRGGKCWFLDESKSGGVALDMHLHDTDEIHYLFGMPKSVSSKSHLHKDGWTDFIATTYSYPDKVVTSSSSWAMTPSFVWESGFRVVFEKAVVVFNSHANPTFLIYPEKGKPFTPKVPKMSGYEKEIKEFAAWILGLEATPVTAKSARDSVAIVDAERKSAKTARTIRL
jgi:predicted dehydrogenase